MNSSDDDVAQPEAVRSRKRRRCLADSSDEEGSTPPAPAPPPAHRALVVAFLDDEASASDDAGEDGGPETATAADLAFVDDSAPDVEDRSVYQAGAAFSRSPSPTLPAHLVEALPPDELGDDVEQVLVRLPLERVCRGCTVRATYVHGTAGETRPLELLISPYQAPGVLRVLPERGRPDPARGRLRDVAVVLEIAEDPRVQVHGIDLVVEVTIPAIDWVLGRGLLPMWCPRRNRAHPRPFSGRPVPGETVRFAGEGLCRAGERGAAVALVVAVDGSGMVGERADALHACYRALTSPRRATRRDMVARVSGRPR